MLFISYRREFWSNEFYSNHDEMRDVPLHGVGIETPVSEAQFAKRIRGKSVLLLVHGFNNERDQIIAAYDTIVGNLQAHGIVGGASPRYHEVIGLTWPGGRLDISYAAAKLRASAIADSVFARLRTMVAEAKSVDINTHSLGARVALKALGLNGPHNPKDIKNYSKNVKVVDCSRPKLDHGDYKNSPDVFAFYAKELESGNAPQFSKL